MTARGPPLFLLPHFTRLIDSFFEHIDGISAPRSRCYYGAPEVRDAARVKWFEITEHGVVVGMLITTTMNLGEFRYFQIDLHPSNNFRAVDIDWSNF